MSIKLGIQSLLLMVAVLLAGVGCKQYYNGAFGLSMEESETVKDYHRQREERMIAREKAMAERSRQVANGERIEPKTPAELMPPTFDGNEPGETTEPVYFPEEDGRQLGPYRPRPEDRQDNAQGNAGPWGQGPRQYEVSTRPNNLLYPDQAADGRPTTMPRPVNVFGGMPGERSAISPLESTGQVRRVSFTEEGADFDVTLDRAGEHLIYSSTRHRRTSDIYRQRIDGSAITQLTDDSSNEVMPALSPDGKTIAFASDRSGNWDIYLMDAEGGPAVQLTSDRTHDIHPSFSPDGKRLVYCSLGERSGQWQLVTIDVDNPTTKRYIGHGLFPQWSPSGDTILYQRARERGTRWFSVWTVELDDRGEAGSPTEIVWSPSYACITPGWSPDGKAVVFCTVMNPDADTQGDRPAESDVWIARADGSSRTRMTRGRFANLQPVWSGDSSIYFVSNRAAQGVENIWAIDPDDAIKVAFPGTTTGDTNTADVPTKTD